MSNRLTHPYLLLTLTTLFWSGNMVLGRAIRADIPPMTLAFWRWAIALALVLPLALPHLRSQWPQLRKGWKPVLILGVLGVGGYNTLAYVALQYNRRHQRRAAQFLHPHRHHRAFVAVPEEASPPHRGHRCRTVVRRVATIVLRGDTTTLASLSFNVGDLWMLGAVLVWAIYTIGLQWRPAGVHRCSCSPPSRRSA